MATKKTIKLGQTVTYVSTKGYEKAALVVGTPESVQQGHSGVPQLAEGNLHLLVLSPTGHTYSRQSVPNKEIAAQQAPEGTELFGGYFIA